MPSTFSPDPNHLDVGAGTAAQQTARPPQRADHTNGGWDSPSTGATAGAPGTWTPGGSAAPRTLAETAGVTASPATAWTAGQHVVLDDTDDTHVSWNGTAWVAGDGTGVAAERAGGRHKRDE